jgi:phenylalanyl-tRNA synthetase beta chain
MLNMLAWNLNRGGDNARLFEAGHVYERANGASAEPRQICLGATGSASPANVNLPARSYSFFDLKGDVETLLDAFEHSVLHFDVSATDYYHPGRSARAIMDGVVVARFGQLHPEVANARKLRQDVFLAEFDLDTLYEHALRSPRFQPPPRYPAVQRDFSFLFDDAVTFETIEQSVAALRLKELRFFVPAEIFRGGNVPRGKYSLLLRTTFQSSERTLREEEVAQWSAEIVRALAALGGALRA